MVVAEKEMGVGILRLPHVAELVMAVVKAHLLAQTEKITFLDANAVIQVVVTPLATRKTQAERQRQGPVVAGVHVHEGRVPLAVHLNACVRQKTLVTQKTFRFQHQVQVHNIAFVEQEQLADRPLLGLDMDDV